MAWQTRPGSTVPACLDAGEGATGTGSRVTAMKRESGTPAAKRGHKRPPNEMEGAVGALRKSGRNGRSNSAAVEGVVTVQAARGLSLLG